jgi:intein/homing endonuclease
MAITNPFKLLTKLTPKPTTIPAAELKGKVSKEDIDTLRRLGITLNELTHKVQLETTVNYDRIQLYAEVSRSLEHWFMGPALGLYADYVTRFNSLQNSSVWVTSDDPIYQREITKLLERIGIEEKIFDWAWTTGGFGDLFIGVKGQPGLGVTSIEDDEHPQNYSRIDHDGCLIGFYRTPTGGMSSGPQKVIPPWELVHMRVLGAKRKRPIYGDPTHMEFRSAYLMSGTDTKQITSRYGTCLPRHMLIDTDSGMRQIGDIVDKKLRVNVKSYNRKTGLVEYKPIVNWFRRTNDESLVRIKFNSRSQGKQIVCTQDHLILTSDRGWVRACDITLNDKLMVESFDISDDQRQVLIGGILGDGSFSNRYSKLLNRYVASEFTFTQSSIHKDFMDWIVRNLKNLDPAVFGIVRKSRVNESKLNGTTTLRTKKCVGFDDIYRAGYRGGKKYITRELLDMLTPFGLAVWIMGDGSFAWSSGAYRKDKYRQPPRLKSIICTDSFSRKECEIIKQWLFEKYGIKSRIGCPPSTNKCRIIMERRATDKLREVIKEYLVVDETKSGSDRKVWVADDITVGDSVVVVPVNVDSVELFVSKRGQTDREVFDVEVADNHNFFVNGAVVHNSIMLDGIPVYKRLRLAEDSLLMARLTRGILRYIWKLRCDSSSIESVEALISQMGGILKKARALDTSAGSPNFDSKFSTLAGNEDIIMPVFSDDVNDLACEKIGGDVDIRWIVDIQELRQQLACAIRVPLSLLGGFVNEATGALGSESIEKLDVGFSRTARRLQRAIRQGIKRIAQIHLAYMNMDPDPALFDIMMSEGSTAEEEVARDSLEKGADSVQKMLDVFDAVGVPIDKAKLIDYLNRKIIKLDDFNVYDYILPGGDVENPQITDSVEPLVAKKTPINEAAIREVQRIKARGVHNTDLVSYLPIDGSNDKPVGSVFMDRTRDIWEEMYGESTVKVDPKTTNENNGK